jgi:hypothetical protein
MSTYADFLEGWFAAFYRFDGYVLVLEAFFDETGGTEDDAVTAVAGFVFDKPGLESFTHAWGPQVEGLSKPYRSALCNAGRTPFDPPDWPEPRRQGLMDSLASLSAENSVAGFVAATTEADYHAAITKSPKLRNLIDSPYTLCTLAVLFAVRTWSKAYGDNERIYCWFERGGYHWEEARQFVSRMYNRRFMVEIIDSFEGVSWIPKTNAPAFCSADLLAWEWRQNLLRDEDGWTPRLARMLSSMRADSKKLLAQYVKASDVDIWALVSGLNRLHRD